MKKIFLGFFIVLILSGCITIKPSPVSQTPNTARTETLPPTRTATLLPTSTSEPTPTATPAPEPINIDNVKNLGVTGFVGNGLLLDSYYSPDNSLFIVSFSHAIWVMDAKSLKTKCYFNIINEIGYSAITADNKTLVAGITEQVYSNKPIPGAMLTWDLSSCSLMDKQADFEHYPFYFKNVGKDKILSFAYQLIKEKNYLKVFLQQRDSITLEVLSEQKSIDSILDFSSSSNSLAMVDSSSINVFNLAQEFKQSLFQGRISNCDYFANGSISPDGKLAALSGSSSEDCSRVSLWKGIVRIWDVDNGMKIFGDDRFKPGSIVKFISDSKLAIANQLNVEIIDIPSFTIAATLNYSGIGVRNLYDAPIDKVILQVGPESNKFMVISDNGYNVSIQVYDLNNYQLIRTVWIPSVYEDTYQGPNDKDLNSISKITGPLQPYRHYDPNSHPLTVGFNIPKEIRILPDDQKNMAVSPNGQFLAILYDHTGYGYNKFELLKYGSRDPILQESVQDNESGHGFNSVVFNENGNYLAVKEETMTGGDAQKHIIGQYHNTIHSWNLSSMVALPDFTIEGAIQDMTILNSGLLAVTFGIFDNGLSIWNLKNGSLLYSGLSAVNGGNIILSSDESKIIIFSDWTYVPFSYIGQQLSRVYYILESK